MLILGDFYFMIMKKMWIIFLIVEYFVFKQFKIYYDVSTIFAGAGDALGEFYKDIFGLVFSVDGLLKIIFFFSPVILYGIFSKKVFREVCANTIKRLVACSSAILSILILIILCFTAVLNPVYFNKEYMEKEDVQILSEKECMEEINREKGKENYSIKQPFSTYDKVFKILKKEYKLKGQVKSVSNVMCEVIITSDNVFGTTSVWLSYE